MHCCKHFPGFTKIPVYATTPVISLGRTLLQDIYTSTPLALGTISEDYQAEISDSAVISHAGNEVSSKILLPAPSVEEIATYFSLIHPLKYSQPHQPVPAQSSPPLNGLTITAYSAGHTLGGTIWHIQHGMESIVYAVDWNQLKENVLGGAAWLASGGGAEIIEQLRKPTALVCSARGAEENPLGLGRKQRDELLHSHIKATIAKGGTVLIPSESGAKMLDLAYVLERMWQMENGDASNDNPFKSAKLYYASKTAGATISYARSMLEWMDDKIIREFETAASNVSLQQNRTSGSKSSDQTAGGVMNGPFDFKYLKLVERKSQVDKILTRPGPRVIVASDSSLQWGFSQAILQGIAGGSNNLVLLTKKYTKEGGRTTLWDCYQQRVDGVATEPTLDGQTLEQVYTGGRSWSVQSFEAMPLTDKELLLYQQYLATRRQSEQRSDTLGLENSADVVDEASSASSSSSEDSNPERQGKALNASATVAHLNKGKNAADKEVFGVNALLRQPGIYDYDVRDKKGREQMFPYINKRRRGDEFGDLIRPEDYLRADERDEIADDGRRDNIIAQGAGLGLKRKWGDVEAKDRPTEPRPGMNAKRHKVPAAAYGITNGHHGAADQAVNGDVDDLDEEDVEETDRLPQGPSRLQVKSVSIELQLRLGFVDFSSLHDQRTLSMLLPLIQPQKLILTCGSESDTAWLADDYRKKKSRSATGDKNVGAFTPANGETIDASIDTNAWTVKLTHMLTRQLHWQNVRGLGVVTLTGHLAAAKGDEELSADPQDRKRQKLVASSPKIKAESMPEASSAPQSTALPPILDLLPANLAAATRSMAQPLHVGDLRLADLRKLLQAEGHSADFRGEGTLIIDDLVAVRKTGTGQIEVEGGSMSIPPPNRRTRAMEGSFHAVKRRIYEGLAVIAAG